MNIIRGLKTARSEYIWRPSQIFRRIMHEWTYEKNEFKEIVLPWGLPIRVRPNENIGRSISTLGLYDLCVSEAIWRLLDPGELALDVGANIGHMTSIMAKKVGESGRVVSFEPHPGIFEELSFNVRKWSSLKGVAKIHLENIALSDQEGEGVLGLSDDFELNRGTATLVSTSTTSGLSKERINGLFKVTLTSLDRMLKLEKKIGLLKIDVEGHEINVLKGANTLLNNHTIRDIVFEEHASVPTEVTAFLIDRGYKVFYLERSFFGLIAVDICQPFSIKQGEAPNYLATMDPERALMRFRKIGWNVLK